MNELSEIISRLVAELGKDQETEYKANLELQRIVARANAPGAEDERAAVAAALVAELNAMTEPTKDDRGRDVPARIKHSPRVRNRVCRLLSYVAGPNEVPAYVGVLPDLQLREMARCALDRVPGREATDALIGALEDVGPRFRIGVINSLARRGGDAALAAVKSAAADEDPEVRINAIEALSAFPDASSDLLIIEATRTGPARHRVRAQRARVRLAETLHRAGYNGEAKRIFTAIHDGDAGAAQKRAAEIALEAMT